MSLFSSKIHTDILELEYIPRALGINPQNINLSKNRLIRVRPIT